MLNLTQDVKDYIDTLTDDDKIIKALTFATENRDCNAEVVKQLIEQSQE